MAKVEVFEMPLTNDIKSGKKNKARIVILKGGLGEDNPKDYMDRIVEEYIGNEPHNVFIERTLDNPFIRVIIFGIDDLPYKYE